MEFLHFSLVGGIVATLALDLWQVMVKHALGVPMSNWGMVGRWLGHMPKGVFTHESIADAEPVQGEAAIGWVFHYGIGIAYAALYLYLMEHVIVAPVDIISAIVFAMAMLVAPWLILQPAMGLGVFASKAPKPIIPRLHSATSHLAFGAGLYLGLLIG